MTVSEVLATWAADLRYDDLPPEITEGARWRILDIVGCMSAGSRTPVARATERAARETYPGTDGYAVGLEPGLSLAGAAMVNGTAALVLEFDDSHLESAVHVGSPVIAAALPAALRGRLSGRRLIEAVVVGCELACRLGVVAPGRFTPLGFHPTGIFGLFGAIYALAKCRGLSVPETVAAIGHGGSLSAASMASWQDGTSTKSLHAGLAASGAVAAVSLAAHGVSGPSILFDGRLSFFRAHVQDAGRVFPLESLSAELGRSWEFARIAPKLYPCGHYIQPFVEAWLGLVAIDPVKPEDVTELTCFLPDYVVPMVAAPVDEKRRPTTAFHARMSLQHTLAELIVTGRLDRDSFAPEALGDPAIQALSDRVTYEVDPAASDRRQLGGRIRLRLRDGRTREHRITHLRGMPQNPVGVDDLVAKFRANVTGIVPDRQIDRLVEALLGLDQVDNVGSVLRPLCRERIA